MAQRRPVAAHRFKRGVGVGFEQPGDEGVGMVRCNLVGRQAVGGKVPQVAGHDRVRAPVDRRRQHMAVVGVRQVEGGGEGLVSRHDGIGEMAVHDVTGLLQHGRVDIGTVGQKAAHPFGMDVGAPERHIQVAVGKTQQQVAKTGRIEHVGI